MEGEGKFEAEAEAAKGRKEGGQHNVAKGESTGGRNGRSAGRVQLLAIARLARSLNRNAPHSVAMGKCDQRGWKEVPDTSGKAGIAVFLLEPKTSKIDLRLGGALPSAARFDDG